MNIFKDDPSKTIPVLWYFVDPKNGVLPYESPFYSRVWDLWEVVPPPLSELYTPRPYRNGITPQGLSVGGICGTADQWLNGCLSNDPVPPFQPDSISPVCCARLPVQAIGGARVGSKYQTFCGLDGIAYPPIVYGLFEFSGPGSCPVLDNQIVPFYRNDSFSPNCHGDVPVYMTLPFLYAGNPMQMDLQCLPPLSPDWMSLTAWFLATCSPANTDGVYPGGPEFWNWQQPTFVFFGVPGCSVPDTYRVNFYR